MARNARLVLCLCGFTLGSTGCTTDGQWSVSRMLGWDDQPAAPKLPKAHIETAERVENLGRRIITQNTFTGIEPLFNTFGVPESILFHRGTKELFISEGLVRQCKSEGELAAVLSSELARMMVEKNSARRTGSDRDSFPEIGVPTGSGLAGGTPADPGRAAEVAFLEKQRAKESNREVSDPTQVARDLLRGAGFDPVELERVAPLLKQSARGVSLQKQMSGSAPPPTWQR